MDSWLRCVSGVGSWDSSIDIVQYYSKRSKGLIGLKRARAFSKLTWRAHIIFNY